MGGTELGKCAKITAVVLFLVNILFALFGVIVLAIGIWAIVQNQDYAFLTGSSVVSGGALLIVCGVITLTISAIGMVGVLFKLRPLLIIYAAVILVIVILEVVAGILTFVFSDAFDSQVESRVLDAISRYRVGAQDSPGVVEEDVNDAVDSFQSFFECCGWTNASDWIMSNPMAIMDNGGHPPSCVKCNVTADGTGSCAQFTNATAGIDFSTTPDGCRDASNTRFTVIAYTVGGLGIAFGILEVVGICLALFLCCCITSARKQTVV